MLFEDDFDDSLGGNDWTQAERKALKAFGLYENGQLDDALSSINEALDINPSSSVWHFNKALTLDSINRFDDAIGEYEGRIEESFKERQELEARLSSLMSIREVDQRGLELGFPDRQKVFFVLREDAGPGQTASLREGSVRGLVQP